MLDIYKLQNQYLSLQYRTRALRSQSTIPVEEAEGFELTEKTPSSSTGMEVSNEKVMAIKKEWRGWRLASIKNTYVPVSPLFLSSLLRSPHCLTVLTVISTGSMEAANIANNQWLRPAYTPLGSWTYVDKPTYHQRTRLCGCHRQDS
jgi:hypothetical protein